MGIDIDMLLRPVTVCPGRAKWSRKRQGRDQRGRPGKHGLHTSRALTDSWVCQDVEDGLCWHLMEYSKRNAELMAVFVSRRGYTNVRVVPWGKALVAP